MILDWLERAPRRVMALVALVCGLLIGFSMYLQHVVGLEPCPMCIVQRYAVILVGITALVTALVPNRVGTMIGSGLVVLFAGFGAFVAARQSWIQWYPPEIASCGRDFYGMIESFPLKRAIPMIFRGSGDCTKIDWTFLGLSIANWTFIAFCAMAIAALVIIARQWRRPVQGASYA